ncbi:MAG: DUF3054 domain-containing protein [Ilumatobacter sp.]|nr:DUF3054 domain-containing protein [Ilumatobacter sp.]
MHRRTPLAAGLDTAIVVAFVAIGRRNHDEDEAVSGLISTAAPFLLALAVAWAVWRVWHQPTGVITGARVWATTVVLGMLLRRVLFDDGTATAFVVVATVFLGVLLVGWRAALTVVDARTT